MPRIRKAECCEYREEKKKQGIKKLQKKMAATKGKRADNSSNDCHDDNEEIVDHKCEENKRFSKPGKYVSIAEEMIGKIKPSIEDRMKYIDERHLCCFLEPSEIEKSKCREKLSAARSQHQRTRKKEKVRLDVQSSKLNSDKNQDEEEGRKAESGQSGPKSDASKRKKKRERETYKDSIWDPKSKGMKKTMLKFQESELTESDCEDSICSFDSQINLSGLSLTKEEIEKIEEMRRNKSNPLQDIKKE